MSGAIDEAQLRDDLATQYRRVVALGLNELSSGNISARLGDGMLISPTGASADTITPESFVRMYADGTWAGDTRPSTEWRMHAAVYRAKQSAGAVVHTHSDACVALAAHGRRLPGFTYVVGFFGGDDVPCVPYNTFGTQLLADDAAAALGKRTACLLANHGMIARGRDIAATVDAAHRLEILCRQYLAALQIGEPNLLTDADWQDFFVRSKQLAYGQIV